MKVIKWILLVVVLFFILLSGAYWAKTRMGINVFHNFHLSNYFPFNYLLPDDEVLTAEPGFELLANFDQTDLFGYWKGIWSEEVNVAKRRDDPRGYNNSTCLLIFCKHEVLWAVNAGVYIKVKPGDTFHYEAKVKVGNVANDVGISIVSYDGQRSSPDYQFIMKSADMHIVGKWQTIAADFTIPNGVVHIMPRLWGNNQGMVRFDDILLKATDEKK